MAGKFNINQLFGDMPTQAGEGQAAGRETPTRPMLKAIPININDLIPSHKNFYDTDDIAKLKTAIEMFGVTQNLTVTPLEGGKYRIIEGHRRRLACASLVAEGKKNFEHLPCVIKTDLDELCEQLMLIMSNSTQRQLSEYEQIQQIQETERIFAELKHRENIPGRVRELTADYLNISVTQVARADAISKNLTPEFTEELKAGRIGPSVAYELSGMTEDKQKEAFEDYQEKGGLSINDVKEIKQESAPPTAAVTSKNGNEPERDCGNETAAPPIPPPTVAEQPPQKTYPQTPSDFEECQEDEQDAHENQDFADMSAVEKAKAAVDFLNSIRFDLFKPGDDTRLFDFAIETLEHFACGKRD